MSRIDKVNYYLDIAETVLERSTCAREHVGALIVRNDEIIATGYNGAPRGRSNCIDLGYCIRQQRKVPDGERYEICRSVHAEANAIISAARRDILGGTLYLAGRDAKTGELTGPVEVVTGVSDGDKVEIVSGLEEGQTVWYIAYESAEAALFSGAAAPESA